MCGIVGFVGKSKAAPVLLDGLEKLEYRGYDSAGVAVISDAGLSVNKTTGRIRTLKDMTDDGKSIDGNIGIGHTRWATHGAPSDKNAHPHLSRNGKFAVVHNGIIENYIALREELEGKGFVFRSETDTETVAHLLEYYYDGSFSDAVKKTVARLEGSFALGIVCKDCPDTLIAARHASPLIIGVGEGENFIASDVTALVSHTKNVIYLDDGEIALLKTDGVSVINKEGNEYQKEVSVVDWNIEAAEKGGYSHFMLKEIMEQPKAVRDTILPRIKDGKVWFENLNLTADDIKNTNRIIITACGSASYAGQAAKYVYEDLLRIPVEVDLASELRYRNPVVDEHTLLIVISQSGETADTIAAMKEVKKRGAKVVSIVNVVGSTIAKLSDDVLYTWAGPEIAVATTKGYTTQLALLYLFGIYCAGVLGTKSEKEISQLVADVNELPEKIEAALKMNSKILALAKEFHKCQSLFFIGRNIDYAVSMEGSLKLKEISYIHSEAYAAGELKHGTISLIDEGRLVIALACYEQLFDKLMSNIKEVKSRGAKVIATALEGNKTIFTEADEVMFVPKTNPLFLASVEVIPLQLFAFYVAKKTAVILINPVTLQNL